MIIPITKGQQTASGAPAQGMPSETNLMMALATMHEQGRFKVAGDVMQMPGAATPQDRVKKALDTGELNKLTTNKALMSSLGGGAKVLPMAPEDK